VDHEHDDPANERYLLERIREGDAGAFDEVVRLHRLAVYRVARRMTGSHEEADEVAQETFVRAWRSFDGFRGESRLRTWMIRIAVNVSRSVRARRAPVVDLAEAGDPSDAAESAESAASRRQAGARVRAAVATLPPRQREVVTLKIFSDMTYEDVAAAMGLTVGAVKAHFHQAVANLRRRMSGAEVRG
jgi:RNA polymerase sigma-70 factor, ECF subfamily